MENTESFPALVNEFFTNFADINSLNQSGLFFCRPDGVPIYHNNGLGETIDEASIGALLGGVWQASRTLASFIPEDHSNDFFRLSFGTSSKGIYIVPVNYQSEDYYLGMIYFEEVNPGMIKSKLRDLAYKFTDFIDLHEIVPVKNKVEEDNDNLFDDITDAEMDELFAFAGH